MTSTDFIRVFLGLFPDANYDLKSIALLGGIIDSSKWVIRDLCALFLLKPFPKFTLFITGSFHFLSSKHLRGFCVLICPEALYLTTFQLFDTKSSGLVSFGWF